MTEQRFCQSCAMSMTEEAHFGTNADGTKTEQKMRITAATAIKTEAYFPMFQTIHSGKSRRRSNKRQNDYWSGGNRICRVNVRKRRQSEYIISYDL